MAGLTPRERQLVVLICEGLTHREMAREMGISENTTRCFLTRLCDKLGLSNMREVMLRFLPIWAASDVEASRAECSRLQAQVEKLNKELRRERAINARLLGT